MTTRIVTFDDGVTTNTVPSTATTTGPTGETGPAGKAFQVNEFDASFTESKRTEIEAYGTPSGGTLVTGINPYIAVVASDDRTPAQRTAGPAELNRDLSRHVIEWGGKTGTGGSTAGTDKWVDYGVFTGVAGENGLAATANVGNTTTLTAGSSATVSNSGTTAAAVFNFGIPNGATGPDGQPGFNVPSVVSALEIDWTNSTLFTKSISASSTFTFANVAAGTNNGKAILLYLSNTSTTEVTVTWPTSPDTNVNGEDTTVMAGSANWLFSFLNIAGTIVATGRPV